MLNAPRLLRIEVYTNVRFETHVKYLTSLINVYNSYINGYCCNLDLINLLAV